MKYILVLLFLAFTLITRSYTQQAYRPVPTPDTSNITLLFAGDVMGHMPQVNSAFDSSSGKYNFNPVFEYAKPLISQADLAIANLETTLAGPPFSGYPQFSTPDSIAGALKNAGFDILITANNHCIDRGAEGLARTVQMLDSFKILHTGTFLNDSIRNLTYPLIVTSKGFKLAFLNYTYGTNGITVKSPYVVNYIDTTLIKGDIFRAKEQMADYIIVTLHWGIEYERLENANQQSVANFLLKQGADMVIGSHPHVVQPIRKYYFNPQDSSKYNLVVYSLGNYVSNQRDRFKDGGIMVEVKLQKVRLTKLKDYTYTPVWVYKGTINNKIEYKLIPMKDSLINFDFMNKQDYEASKLFFEDTQSLINSPTIAK